jgi:hypothetical protein
MFRRIKVSQNMARRAVLYARVSTADQVEGTSLDTQKVWCLAEIKSQGWEFIDQYVDAGLSGADSSRPEWQRLLSDARRGLFDSVFVYDLDRFTRDMLHGLQATRELRQLEVTLHDAKNPKSDAASVDSQLMTGFRLLIAEEERRAHPVPNNTERENLRIMYSLLAKDRLGVGALCERLAILGIEARNGGRWSHTVLRRVLSNPTLHTGWIIWGEPKGGSTDGRSHKTRVNKDGKPTYGDPVKVHLPSPPFSKAEFQEMQRQLARHARAGGTQIQHPPRFLTGRIFGACGKHYTGTGLIGKDHSIYRCTGNRHRGREAKFERCGCHQINAQLIEARVWDEIVGLLGEPDRLKAMAMKWLEIAGDDPAPEVHLRKAKMTEQIGKLNRAIDRARDDLYLEDVQDPADLRGRITRYLQELEILENQKRTLDAYSQDAERNSTQLDSLSNLAIRASERLGELTGEEKREIIALLKIQVFIGSVETSEPQTLNIHGLLDPSLFAAGETRSHLPSFVFQL